jgi:hypothetical protein
MALHTALGKHLGAELQARSVGFGIAEHDRRERLAASLLKLGRDLLLQIVPEVALFLVGCFIVERRGSRAWRESRSLGRTATGDGGSPDDDTQNHSCIQRELSLHPMVATARVTPASPTTPGARVPQKSNSRAVACLE